MQTDPDNRTESDDDDFSWPIFFVVIAVVAAAAWALIHYNPSEEDHREKVGKMLVEVMEDGYMPSLSTAKALKRLKYHSLGICSWTSTTQYQKPRLVTVGILGYVLPVIKM